MNELSHEAKALIQRVGTADGPSYADRARVRRRIVASLAGAGATLGSGTIAAGAPAGAATGVKVTVSSVALWLATGAALGTAASVPAVVSAYRRAEPAPTPAQVSAPVAAPNQTPERPSPPVTPAAKPEAAPSPASKAVERPVAEGSRSPTPTGAASLAEETRLLEEAQRELAQKRTSAALALLDEHAARFPHGALAEERAAARVLALCALGRSAEARLVAEAFVRASPHSPLVPRLRGSCASEARSSDDAL